MVALETGRAWDPSRDFATDEAAQEKLSWAVERLSAGDDPLPFGRNNSRTGVGGSTLHYTAYTPRAQADDFGLHGEFGVGVDWPIGYDDLAPYYVAGFLGPCAAATTAAKIAARPLSPSARDQFVTDYLSTSRSAWEWWLKTGSREDLTGLQLPPNLPVLAICGEKDQAIPTSVVRREVVDRAHGSRLVTIANAGHLLPYEAARELAARIIEAHPPTGTQ